SYNRSLAFMGEASPNTRQVLAFNSEIMGIAAGDIATHAIFDVTLLILSELEDLVSGLTPT
ncbi:MAG: hypothetical protein WBP38_00100, partial [Hyphomicrobium sp.]